MKLTCFDAVDLSLSGAIESHPKLKIDMGKLDSLRADCALIDQIAGNNDCDGISASVDVESGSVIIAISCPVIEFAGGRRDVFFGVIQRTSSFSFSQEQETGNVLLSFSFGGVISNE